jgi:hypothetical protein
MCTHKPFCPESIRIPFRPIESCSDFERNLDQIQNLCAWNRLPAQHLVLSILRTAQAFLSRSTESIRIPFRPIESSSDSDFKRNLDQIQNRFIKQIAVAQQLLVHVRHNLVSAHNSFIYCMAVHSSDSKEIWYRSRTSAFNRFPSYLDVVPRSRTADTVSTTENARYSSPPTSKAIWSSTYPDDYKHRQHTGTFERIRCS